MSGTSMDGVDVSIIKSDGYDQFFSIFDDYYEYNNEFYKELTQLREKISNSTDLISCYDEIVNIDKKFTLFNSKIIKKVIDENQVKIDLIGFHGQTILHLPEKKISKQIGDGKLLSQLTRKVIVNNFRQNDLKNGGQGAPLTPVFHYLLSRILSDSHQLKHPINFINIGGITNVTQVKNKNNDLENSLFAYDIAPGNCLIDEWVRKKSNKRYDQNGNIGKSGKVNELILNQAIENFKINSFNESLDVKNFDLSFVKGLSLEDGCATLTKFTAYLIYEGISHIDSRNNIKTKNYLVSGGGRKNKFLIQSINSFFRNKDVVLKNIDDYKINGDFVESQAFAYLAIRSYLNLPISFPNTTRCNKKISGGVVEKNF